MRRSLVCAALVLLSLATAGPAAAAPKLSVSGPARVDAGASATFTVTLRPGATALRKGTLALTLSTDRKPDRRDRKLHSRTVRNVKARKSAKLKLKVTLPAATAPRGYRVIACLKVGKRSTCADRKLTVTRRAPQPQPTPAAPQPSAPLPQPAPQPPAPTATATPIATPTATATATPAPVIDPVVVTDPPPAPGPADPVAVEPSTVAPPLDPALPTSLEAATSFLYTGANPIQKGVAPDTIELPRAAVLRGTVSNRLGGPVAGVRVTVLDHPEYGRTATQADGGYDLAVNGGGQLTLVFEREGYVPAQRIVDVPWQDYAEVDPLVLIPYDPRATRVDTRSGAISAVQGTTISDASGTRTQTLLFAPGTLAEIKVGGAYRALGQRFTVRSTEFTQGPSGEDAMPGQLPPATAYTYAAEFSLDEAVAAGATDVRFSKPVATYLDNFLAMPVGTIVPAGWYDREAGEWVGAPNGRVVKLLAGGVDTDGDGTADNRGIGAGERAALATLYPVGKELWRVEVTHFTPWDYNHPYGPAPGAGPPGPGAGPPGPSPDPDNPCAQEGSIILCDDQVLGEELPVAGTDQRLVYRSDRTPGRRADRMLPITLRDGDVDPSLREIALEIEIAGRSLRYSFTPAQAAADPVYTFTWDGLDVYGRQVQGSVPVTVRLSYRFAAVYQAPLEFASSWARLSGIPIATSGSRSDFTLSSTYTTSLTAADARATGLGGWTLSDHHVYDPQSRTVTLGDGGFAGVAAKRLGALEPLAVGFDGPAGIAAAPDGSFWVADARTQRIRRVDSEGAVTTVAGVTGAYGYRAADEGALATAARLSSPQGIAVGDRDAYVADTGANRIRRIAPDGRITTVAGGGGALGDNGPATSARLSGPTGVAISPDGSLAIADTNQHRVRLVGTDGTITTVAGDGTPGARGDGGPASGARLRAPAAVAYDADGRLLIADAGNGRVRRVSTDGRIETLVDGLGEPTGLAVGLDGTILIADAAAGLIRARASDGSVRTIAGGGSEPRAEGAPSTAVELAAPTGVAIRGDGTFAFTEPSADRVSAVREPLPGFDYGDALIGSGDGAQVFHFSAGGRHLRTLDALTGAVLRRFTYDAQGRLEQVFDQHSPVLTITRPDATTIVLTARGNRVTTLRLDAAGWLSAVADPTNAAHTLTHAADGLLRGERDAEGGTHEFDYDALGRLVRDRNPDGVERTLTRRAVADGFEVDVTAGGLVTTYRNTLDDTGAFRHRVTFPGGATVSSLRRPDGSLRVTDADGTTIDQQLAPDPRFGLQAPYPAAETVTTPGGRTSTATMTRSVQMRDALRLEQLVDTITRDGQATTRTFTARPGDDGGTLTVRSPLGRVATTELDRHGRVTSARRAAGERAFTTTYDDAADGRVVRQAHGARGVTYAYDAAGRVISSTDDTGRVTTFTHDAANRLLSTSIGGATWSSTLDAAGRPTDYRQPSGRTSTFATTAAGLDRTLTLPGGDAYAVTRDALGRLTANALPSGAGQTYGYDAAGRIQTRAATRAGGAPATSTTFGYVGATERLAGADWAAGAVEQELEFTYDGDLPVTISASAGTVEFTTPATGLQPSAMRIAAGAGEPVEIALERDADRLPTRQGAYTIGRDAATGRARTYTAGDTVVELTDAEGYGQVDQRALRKGADAAYTLTVERDAAGRVARTTEVVDGGPPVVRAYTHDAQGRLTRVADGAGATVEAYAYDDDGNRISAGGESATYDARGTQTALGARVLAFGADGQLTNRFGTAYDYAPTGELLQAGAVSYAYDGLRRLTRRTVGGQTTAYLYGNPDAPFELTASTDGAGVLTTYFYDDTGTLHAFERGGARYRVGADQVGTPRVVLDAGTGAIVKRVERDAFGRVLSDSHPEFELAIGFAGGIEDPTTGLVRFGLRDYDPETGRWTSRDPSMYGGSPRNLYAYADNAPATRRDPSGLFSIGASAYVGVGGGGSLNVDGGGFGFCLEVGVGAGAGVEADLAGKAENSIQSFASLSAEAGRYGVSLTAERDPCNPNRPDKVGVKGSLGPVQAGYDSHGGVSLGAGKGVAAELQGKVGIKQCWKWSWW